MKIGSMLKAGTGSPRTHFLAGSHALRVHGA